MNALRAFAIAISISLLLSACAGTTWHTSRAEAITPSSYSVYKSPLSRGVGKLRKLYLVRVYFPVPEICTGEPEREKEVLVGSSIYTKLLENEKGYEVVRATDEDHSRIEKVGARGFNALDRLFEAADHTDDVAPASNVVHALREVVGAHQVDALVLVEFGRGCFMSNPAYWTLLLAAPEEAYSVYLSYRATIFEMFSGKVVWQSVFQFPQETRKAEEIFGDLETAVPVLLTK